MPRDLRAHNYIRKGLRICLYGRGKLKTSCCLGLVLRASSKGLPCALISASKAVWGAKSWSKCCVYKLSKPSVRAYNLGKTEVRIVLALYWCIICKLVGDPFWLCVCLDEPALSYKRKLKTQFLFALRPSFQTVCIASRSQMVSQCAIQFICRRSHFNKGFCAQTGLEY
ncbi:MAG: hypothetical protein AAI946_00325 [Candidatus Hodgkinia cicadicola]